MLKRNRQKRSPALQTAPDSIPIFIFILSRDFLLWKNEKEEEEREKSHP